MKKHIKKEWKKTSISFKKYEKIKNKTKDLSLKHIK